MEASSSFVNKFDAKKIKLHQVSVSVRAELSPAQSQLVFPLIYWYSRVRFILYVNILQGWKKGLHSRAILFIHSWAGYQIHFA